MENAIDALKMVFAILILILALTLTISLVSQIKTTADAVFYARDKTNYFDYQQEGERTVGIETILPTVYRYSKENYGVTIIDNGVIVARFDVDTEAFLNNYVNSENEDVKKKVKEYKQKLYNQLELNRYEVNEKEFVDKKSIENLYRYTTTDNPTRQIYGAPWSGIQSEIIKRLNADFAGKNKIANFQGNKKYVGCLDALEGNQNGLINKYSQSKFKENVVRLIISEQETDKSIDPDTGDYVDLIKPTEKIEIIYLKQ